jgi:hypothetical protein
MISPPDAPVACSIVRLLIYTAGVARTQHQKENVLAKAEFTVHNGEPRTPNLRRVDVQRLPRRVSDAKESDGPPREAGRENRPLPQVWLPRGRCPSIADHRRAVLWLRPTEDGERTGLQLQGVSKPLARADAGRRRAAIGAMNDALRPADQRRGKDHDLHSEQACWNRGLHDKSASGRGRLPSWNISPGS